MTGEVDIPKHSIERFGYFIPTLNGADASCLSQLVWEKELRSALQRQRIERLGQCDFVNIDVTFLAVVLSVCRGS
jgi:hypothetical protein